MVHTNGDDTKHVQTELTENEYERFREFAREQDLSLKAAGREAVLEWIDRRQRPDPTDPAFTVLDELDGDALPAPPEVEAEMGAAGEADARERDAPGDGVDGEPFALADEPADRS